MKELGGAVHCRQAYHGPLPGVRETPGDKGGSVVVGEFGFKDRGVAGGQGDEGDGRVIGGVGIYGHKTEI